jgi:hypothetical protein
VHRHLLRPRRSEPLADTPRRLHRHGHAHGLIDDSIKRSREGMRAVSLALLVLVVTAVGQVVVFALSGSTALLADLIHNVGDASTAILLGIAFALRSERAERWAGLAVVLAIFVSACVAGFEAVDRLITRATSMRSARSRSPACSASRGTGWPPGSAHARAGDSRAPLSLRTARTRAPTRTSASRSSPARPRSPPGQGSWIH